MDYFKPLTSTPIYFDPRDPQEAGLVDPEIPQESRNPDKKCKQTHRRPLVAKARTHVFSNDVIKTDITIALA